VLFALLVILLWVALLLPGAALVERWAPEAPALVRLGLAAGLGTTIAIVKAVLLHVGMWMPRPGALWIIESAVFIVSAVSLAMARRERGRRRDRSVLVVSGVTLVASCLRMWPHDFALEPLPVYDAAAHCTLVAALAENPGRATWLPFMDAPPHYPWGGHAVVLELHRLTGFPIHGVFAVTLTAGLGGVSILAVTGFARTIWRRDLPAMGAGAAYASLSLALGATYARWGGLPAELGFALALVMGIALLERRTNPWAAPLLWLGLLLAHHLTPIIVGVAVIPCVLALGFVHPRLRVWFGWTMARLGLAAGFALPMWSSIFAGGDPTADTVALAIPRTMDLFDLVGNTIGSLLVAFAVVPLATGRLPPRLGRVVLLGLATGLLVGFTGCYSLAKVIHAVAGSAGTALVPSRWAAALTYPLAVLAGGGVAEVWQWGVRVGKPWWRWAGVTIFMLVPAYPLWRQAATTTYDRNAWAAYQLTGEVSRPQDIIVVLASDPRWAGYLSRRAATTVPAPPGSDPLTPEAQARRAMPRHVLEGSPAPASPADTDFYVVLDRRMHPLPSGGFLQAVAAFDSVIVFRWGRREPSR